MISAAKAAVKRILGQSALEKICFSHWDRKDAFEIHSCKDGIEITGDSALSLLCGLNHYCRHILNIQLSWQNPTATLPDVLPALNKPIFMQSPFHVRYYLNYCTYSYTMAFWDWERWEIELDLMALGGVNMALSLIGQETVLLETLLRLGMGKAQIRRYITGPAHLAWFFMGNMTEFGGDLTDEWFVDRLVLGNKIHSRMQELGIAPVLPGFYGVVPKELGELYPTSHILPQGKWCGFDRPGFVADTDPLFELFATTYYATQKELMGDITRFFTAEPFHEGGDPSVVDLPRFGKNVLTHMRNRRKDAIWVLQAWDSNPFMALFEQIEKNDILILNLLAGRIADFSQITNDFSSHPWVWCPVHSYGGRNPLYGFLRTMAREPIELVQSGQSAICGIGVSPESLETNPIFYDLFWDLTYHNTPIDMPDWLHGYVKRRYSMVTPNTLKAWQLLEDSVYNSFVPQPGGVESMICARPDFGLKSASSWAAKSMNYDIRFVLDAAKLLFADYDLLQANGAYRYDLIDVIKQALSNFSRTLYAKLMYLLGQKLYEDFFSSAQRFLQLIKFTDDLLNADEGFTLHRWLHAAKTYGEKYGQGEAFKTAALTQITLWGNKTASISLHDYANKEWGGLTGGFYYMRWEHFFKEIKSWLDSGNPLDVTASMSRDFDSGDPAQASQHFYIDWYKVEIDWINGSSFNKHSPCSELKTAASHALDLIH